MVEVNKEKCIGCGTCVAVCPVGAITLSDGEEYAIIDHDLCIECFTCIETCPEEAIYKDEDKSNG